MKYFLLPFLLFMATNAHAIPLLKSTHELGSPFKPAKGKELFEINGCALCHGEDGSGDGPMADNLKNKPRNFRDYHEMSRMPDVRMEQAIREGLQGTAMPAFPDLSQQDIEALVAYLRSFLVDSESVVTMCLYETAVLDAQKAPAKFRVEVDEPEKVEAETKNKKVHIRIKNWGKFLEKKSWRTHVRLMKDERIFSLVTIKVKPCLDNIEELVKSLAAKAGTP